MPHPLWTPPECSKKLVMRFRRNVGAHTVPSPSLVPTVTILTKTVYNMRMNTCRSAALLTLSEMQTRQKSQAFRTSLRASTDTRVFATANCTLCVCAHGHDSVAATMATAKLNATIHANSCLYTVNHCTAAVQNELCCGAFLVVSITCDTAVAAVTRSGNDRAGVLMPV